MSIDDICKTLKISRASFYRYLSLSRDKSNDIQRILHGSLVLPFVRLLMHSAMTAKCRKIIPQFLEMIDALPVEGGDCQNVAIRKSNGITEGFHRKMKLIQHRAYGFRNFENYRWYLKKERFTGL
jgi:hypothetical protein